MEQRNAYPFTEVAVEKPVLQNAFMLFYERRSRSRVSSSPSSDIHPAAVPGVAKSSSAEAVGRDQLLPCRSRSVLMPVLHQIDSSNQQVARNAFLIDPALPRFLVSVAEDLVTKTLVRSGTSATSVCSWLTSANDALAAHLKSATFRPAMTVQQQFSHASVAPPRIPFVPALTLLVDSKLSEALSVVGTLSESTLRVRVTEILASAAVRGSGISGVEMPYQVGATHMSEGEIVRCTWNRAQQKNAVVLFHSSGFSRLSSWRCVLIYTYLLLRGSQRRVLCALFRSFFPRAFMTWGA